MNKFSALDSNNNIAKTLAIVGLVIGGLGILGSIILAFDAYDPLLILVIGIPSSAFTGLLLLAAGEVIALLQSISDKSGAPVVVGGQNANAAGQNATASTIKDIERSLPRL